MAAAAAASPQSMFDINLGVTAFVLFTGLGLAGVALASGELTNQRVAKQVPGE